MHTITKSQPSTNEKKGIRYYISLILLFVPPLLFTFVLLVFNQAPELGIQNSFPYLPWQFIAMGIFGSIATLGGVLDWKYHRNPLNLKISKKERNAEAGALGLGGVTMIILMSLATFSEQPKWFLIPIILVLIYTTVAICYDEFVFHIKRCEKIETLYHRMLVLGNGLAWLCWFHFIYL